MANMSRYDITSGGRRHIVSDDQAKNLREQEDLRRMAEGLPIVCALPYTAAERLEDEGELWDELGEESQDPGWT